MNTSIVYDVVNIGNYTKDTIISPIGTRHIDGGGSRYAAHASAALGRKTAVVTRLSKEDEHVVKAFRQAGIDCYPTFTPSSTLMCLDYPTTDPDIRKLTVANTAGTITSAQLEGLEMRSAVIGSSLRGEIGIDVFKLLREKNIYIAADVQGFIRVLRGQDLINETWDEMQETLTYLDILKSDAVEAEFLTGEADIFKAALIFESMGPKEIVLTHKNGVLILADGNFHDLPFFPKNLSGRSGRGDTCIGTYVAMRLTKAPLEAGIWAAAVTSLKMEKSSPFDRPISDVEDLIYARYNHGSNRQ